jgi:hypothetical protein
MLFMSDGVFKDKGDYVMVVTAQCLAGTAQCPLENTGKSLCDTATNVQFHLATSIRPIIESILQEASYTLDLLPISK